MMNSSLRLRLVAIILIPLLLISAMVATWAVYDARERANERFDRSLLSAALAVSRDIAVSDGDAISPETNALLQDTSGGRVFYHVFAPDGVFVTGYATPPVPQIETESEAGPQTYFDGRHQGSDVRALKFSDVMLIDGLSGEFTFTVWQDADLRTAIVRDLSWRTFQVIASLIVALALVVWFGVRIGLRPIMVLESAIARRSPDDLTAIQRQVPVEAKGIVATLNRLLGQVTETMEAKDAFISNAAHQLRNPIAGVVAMSEALQSAKTMEDMKERSKELMAASKQAGDLANKLLTYERAAAPSSLRTTKRFDCSLLLANLVDDLSHLAANQSVELETDLSDGPLLLPGDKTMIREAVKNLIENALLHGGKTLTKITVAAARSKNGVLISVTDNGVGIPPEQTDKVRERFVQLNASQGSGLGLAIADAVATSHDGQLHLSPNARGISVELWLPA